MFSFMAFKLVRLAWGSVPSICEVVLGTGRSVVVHVRAVLWKGLLVEEGEREVCGSGAKKLDVVIVAVKCSYFVRQLGGTLPSRHSLTTIGRALSMR